MRLYPIRGSRAPGDRRSVAPKRRACRGTSRFVGCLAKQTGISIFDGGERVSRIAKAETFDCFCRRHTLWHDEPHSLQRGRLRGGARSWKDLPIASTRRPRSGERITVSTNVSIDCSRCDAGFMSLDRSRGHRPWAFQESILITYSSRIIFTRHTRSCEGRFRPENAMK